jgi:hypothetical protein
VLEHVYSVVTVAQAFLDRNQRGDVLDQLLSPFVDKA